MLRLVTTFFAVAVALVPLAACQQGEGQRCQINADCEDGLTCNRSTNTCLSGSTQSGVDAGIDAPLDAPDAAVDAAVDAPTDAAPDA